MWWHNGQERPTSPVTLKIVASTKVVSIYGAICVGNLFILRCKSMGSFSHQGLVLQGLERPDIDHPGKSWVGLGTPVLEAPSQHSPLAKMCFGVSVAHISKWRNPNFLCLPRWTLEILVLSTSGIPEQDQALQVPRKCIALCPTASRGRTRMSCFTQRSGLGMLGEIPAQLICLIY